MKGDFYMENDKFTTKKDDLTKIGKLTKEELEHYLKTKELPERIKSKIETR
jgi:hypothetical protein